MTPSTISKTNDLYSSLKDGEGATAKDTPRTNKALRLTTTKFIEFTKGLERELATLERSLKTLAREYTSKLKNGTAP